MRGKQVLYGFMLLLALLPLAAGAGYMVGERVAEERVRVGIIEARDLGVVLEVYVNGELVYIDDDPAVNNFGYMLAELVASTQGWNITAEDGSTQGDAFSTTGGADGKIVVSNDSLGIFDRTMVAVPSGTLSYSVNPSASVTSDANGVYVTISGSITVDQNIDVYWVGLYAYVNVITGSVGTPSYVLLLADFLSTPVSLVAGDTITVVYKIILP